MLGQQYRIMKNFYNNRKQTNKDKNKNFNTNTKSNSYTNTNTNTNLQLNKDDLNTNKINTPLGKLFDMVDTILSKVPFFANKLFNKSNDKIFILIDKIINVTLFILILTFIIVIICYMFFNLYFVLGWLWFATFFWILLFILKLVNIQYIFFQNVVNTENYNDAHGFHKSILRILKSIVSNYGSSISFVMLNAVILSCIKILPFDKNYIYSPLIFLVVILFVFYVIVSSFFFVVLNKAKYFLAKIFLFLFLYLVLTFLLIYLNSAFVDKLVGGFLVHIESVLPTGPTNIDNSSEQYNLSSSILDKYLILQDMPDFKDVNNFTYFLSLLLFIFILILNVVIIFLTSKKPILKAINLILYMLVDRTYNVLKLNDKLKN